MDADYQMPIGSITCEYISGYLIDLMYLCVPVITLLLQFPLVKFDVEARSFIIRNIYYALLTHISGCTCHIAHLLLIIHDPTPIPISLVQINKKFHHFFRKHSFWCKLCIPMVNEFVNTFHHLERLTY